MKKLVKAIALGGVLGLALSAAPANAQPNPEHYQRYGFGSPLEMEIFLGIGGSGTTGAAGRSNREFAKRKVKEATEECQGDQNCVRQKACTKTRARTESCEDVNGK